MHRNVHSGQGHVGVAGHCGRKTKFQKADISGARELHTGRLAKRALARLLMKSVSDPGWILPRSKSLAGLAASMPFRVQVRHMHEN